MEELPRLREPAGNWHLRKTERGLGWAFADRAELCGCSGGAVIKLEHEFLGRLGPKNYHPAYTTVRLPQDVACGFLKTTTCGR